MDSYYRLVMVDVIFCALALFSLFEGEKTKKKSSSSIESLEQRTIGLFNRNSESIRNANDTILRLKNELSELKTQLIEISLRLKQLETHPEVRARNAATKAADELLNSRW